MCSVYSYIFSKIRSRKTGSMLRWSWIGCSYGSLPLLSSSARVASFFMHQPSMTIESLLILSYQKLQCLYSIAEDKAEWKTHGVHLNNWNNKYTKPQKRSHIELIYYCWTIFEKSSANGSKPSLYSSHVLRSGLWLMVHVYRFHAFTSAYRAIDRHKEEDSRPNNFLFSTSSDSKVAIPPVELSLQSCLLFWYCSAVLFRLL